MTTALFKRNVAILIAGVLALAVGLWLNVKWFPYQVTTTFYAINILPGFLLMASWILASKFPQRRWAFIGLGLLVAILSIVLAAFANFGVAIWVSATTPIQDIARYEEIVAGYDKKLAAHFPSRIPENATQVTFYYLPSFLQGGSYLQLRCKLPSSEVNSVLQQYRPVAKRVENGTGEVIEAVDEQHHLPITSFRNEENTEFAPLPEDFIVLILDAEPYEPGNWNHGYTYGVAASTQRQEVIYWAEYW